MVNKEGFEGGLSKMFGKEQIYFGWGWILKLFIGQLVDCGTIWTIIVILVIFEGKKLFESQKLFKI